MDLETARTVIKTALESAAALQQLIPLLKASCTPTEYRDLARGIAQALDGIGINVLERAFAAYPELRAEVDASIAATGRYR